MKKISKIAIIGGGLIGMSWASLFLARGFKVVVVDPRDDAERELSDFVGQAWPMLQALQLTSSETVGEAGFSNTISDLTDVDFVQECGPDRIEIKRDLIAQLEATVAADVVIASSTSSLLATDFQRGCQHPERILVGHPMNPPHLLPLVELVAGKQTSEQSMTVAESVYRDLDRVTIRVQKETIGHLANRLTSALYREAVHIVAEGIASVEDVDKAIANGPGMRWALMGPNLIYHLGGGKGGYRHYLDHLGPTQEARWSEHGNPALTDDLKNALVEGLKIALEGQDEATLTARRDAALVKLAQIKSSFGF